MCFPFQLPKSQKNSRGFKKVRNNQLPVGYSLMPRNELGREKIGQRALPFGKQYTSSVQHFLSQLVFQGHDFILRPRRTVWKDNKKTWLLQKCVFVSKVFCTAIIQFSVIASVLGLGRDTLVSLSFRPLPTLLLFSNNTGYAGDMHTPESKLGR